MKIPLLFILLIGFSFFLNGAGCTKIETPVRPESSGDQSISITPDGFEILDTEPLRLKSSGGEGTVSWSTEPPFEGCFQPAQGDLVLFTPPDVGEELFISIIASDSRGSSVRIEIRIIDEGPPPVPGDVLINEIAWPGTCTSVYDEYIEITNKTDRTFYLNNWKIENAAGAGNPLTFSGKLQPSSLFLIANYPESSEKSAITCRVDCTEAGLSLPNSQAGPYILKNHCGEIFDTVGDGGTYRHGKNDAVMRASMARFTSSIDREWNPESWYTEGTSVNLSDGTCGTPGAPNSDLSDTGSSGEQGANALITEFFIDVNDGSVEDWAELFIIHEGNLKNIVLTDLDGDSDSSITGGLDCVIAAGEYVQVIWSSTFSRDGNIFYIPDVNPTGTKDELVLLRGEEFLDGICYCSTVEAQFDDRDEMLDYGWTGEPIRSKYASRRMDENGSYLRSMQASDWDVETQPTPGAPNHSSP
jgi:hypothetical protein